MEILLCLLFKSFELKPLDSSNYSLQDVRDCVLVDYIEDGNTDQIETTRAEGNEEPKGL